MTIATGQRISAADIAGGGGGGGGPDVQLDLKSWTVDAQGNLVSWTPVVAHAKGIGSVLFTTNSGSPVFRVTFAVPFADDNYSVSAFAGQLDFYNRDTAMSHISGARTTAAYPTRTAAYHDFVTGYITGAPANAPVYRINLSFWKAA